MVGVFETTFLLIFSSVTKMEEAKSCNDCVMCGWKLFSKCKRLFESCLVIVWAIDVDDIIFEGCKWPVEEHKRIG